ncbi:hypothetical protein JR316_0011427 [Psilocybe cubensis]|uniref:Uncharacterized protein n=2 Tax=Psilocybe cubensis TaxID=181762 RepID=A0ACB8GKF0_PSICU|nr:hypothetical protein JR316_0011427 [Psilocybe cubensis]KAH9475867.1 hypothetical protein JR316_0011427 [Psilocybe cubensis]
MVKHASMAFFQRFRRPATVFGVLLFSLITVGFFSGTTLGIPESIRWRTTVEWKESRRFIVGLTERAGHHDEVLGALLYSLRTMQSVRKVLVYRNSFRYKFDETIRPFYPFAPEPAQAMLESLSNPNNTDALDVVILSTGERTIEAIMPTLVEAFDARPPDRKFTVLCVVHDAGRLQELDFIAPLSIRGALRYVTLNQAAQRTLYEGIFAAAARHPEAQFDRVPVYAIAPIFPVQGLKNHQRYILTNVVVQGNMDQGRRDYKKLFDDMMDALKENAEFWGYKPLEEGTNGSYVPLEPSFGMEPFLIHLAGGTVRNLVVPQALLNVVKVHQSLPYPEYFALMNSMDLVLPAFAKEGYYKTSASSSVAAAVIAEVPILASRRLLYCYQYLDERNSVILPSGMSEIEAVRLIRAGITPDTGEPFNREAVYNRTNMERLRQEIYDSNERTLIKAFAL